MTRAAREAAMIRIYERAEQELTNLINAGLLSGAAGTVRYRRRVQRRVRAILQALRSDVLPQVRLLVEESYAEGSGLVQTPLGSFGTPNERALRLLTENLYGRLQDGHTIVGRRVDDVFRREGLRAVATKMATAGTGSSSVKQLVDLLQKQGVTSFVDKAGRHWSLSNYASMAIQTTSREAASQGTIFTMHEMGQDLVEVSHHPHPVDVCTPYDGKTFSISGKDKEFPRLDRIPPFHPRCKHVLKPAAASFDRAAAAAGVAS